MWERGWGGAVLGADSVRSGARSVSCQQMVAMLQMGWGGALTSKGPPGPSYFQGTLAMMDVVTKSLRGASQSVKMLDLGDTVSSLVPLPTQSRLPSVPETVPPGVW